MWALTCGVARRCANLIDRMPHTCLTAGGRRSIVALTCDDVPRAPSRCRGLGAGAATRRLRQSNDPIVLSLLKTPIAQDVEIADRGHGQRVEPHLVLVNVNQVADPVLELGDSCSVWHLALEDAELHASPAAGEGGGHSFSPLVVGDVVRDEVDHFHRPRATRTGRNSSTRSSARLGRPTRALCRNPK